MSSENCGGVKRRLATHAGDMRKLVPFVTGGKLANAFAWPASAPQAESSSFFGLGFRQCLDQYCFAYKTHLQGGLNFHFIAILNGHRHRSHGKNQRQLLQTGNPRAQGP